MYKTHKFIYVENSRSNFGTKFTLKRKIMDSIRDFTPIFRANFSKNTFFEKPWRVLDCCAVKAQPTFALG